MPDERVQRPFGAVPMALRIEAAARAIALEHGALPLEELIEWADAEILAERDYDPRLIDVSLGKTICEAISALQAFGPAADKPKVAARVFRFFHDSLASGNGDGQTIARALYHMAMDGYVPAPEAEGPMWALWDELDLAVDGIYGDAGEIQEKMLRFLANAVR
jgi:hypothetical protein